MAVDGTVDCRSRQYISTDSNISVLFTDKTPPKFEMQEPERAVSAAQEVWRRAVVDHAGKKFVVTERMEHTIRSARNDADVCKRIEECAKKYANDLRISYNDSFICRKCDLFEEDMYDMFSDPFDVAELETYNEYLLEEVLKLYWRERRGAEAVLTDRFGSESAEESNEDESSSESDEDENMQE